MVRLRVLAATACLLRVALPLHAAPQNLAPQAKITSNSEHSAPHLAKFVADGRIPEPHCQEDRHQAWACNGGRHRRGGATITFTWPAGSSAVVQKLCLTNEPQE